MKAILDIPRTAMEVFEMLPEGTLCEVIDNALYMSPSPTTDHQGILGDIFLELALACKKHKYGKVFISPCDVYLDNNLSVVQPDLLFIAEGRQSIIEKKGITGSPNLVMEILSTNLKFDKETKLNLYQRNAIPEYFIINPETKDVLHYLLVNGTYQAQENRAAGQLYIKQLDLLICF